MLESIPINENEVPTISNNTSTSNSGSREKYPNPPCAIAFCEVENEHLVCVIGILYYNINLLQLFSFGNVTLM